MKVLLLLPIWDRKKQWGVFHRGAGNNNFNYGLACVAGYLSYKNVDVEVLDPQFCEGGEDGLKKHLASGAYDVIGISCYTPTVIEVCKTAKLVKEILPNSKVILGGHHPTSFPSECLNECPECDYVVIGEGEETCFELVQRIKNNQDISGIKGVAYRKDGRPVIEKRRTPLDIERLPIPAYSLHDPTRYKLQPTAYRKLPTITLLVSRGCPYPCSFCHAHEILGRKVRHKSIDKTMSELEYLRKNFNAKGFMFQDSTFTYDREWTLSFCEAVKKEKWNISWLCFTRADKVDRELLKVMKEAGCWGISYGVESANQKSLDLIRKCMTVEQNEQSIKESLKAGMYVTATYMLGLPGEDLNDVKRTIAFAKRMGTHIAHFFLPVPYPNTELYRQCKEDGGIREGIEWSKFNILNIHDPVYVNPRIDLKQLLELKEKATKSYYTNPKVIWRNLGTIRGKDDIRRCFNAFRALSGLWVE